MGALGSTGSSVAALLAVRCGGDFSCWGFFVGPGGCGFGGLALFVVGSDGLRDPPHASQNRWSSRRTGVLQSGLGQVRFTINQSWPKLVCGGAFASISSGGSWSHSASSTRGCQIVLVVDSCYRSATVSAWVAAEAWSLETASVLGARLAGRKYAVVVALPEVTASSVLTVAFLAEP